jgi:hypothetical protein
MNYRTVFVQDSVGTVLALNGTHKTVPSSMKKNKPYRALKACPSKRLQPHNRSTRLQRWHQYADRLKLALTIIEIFFVIGRSVDDLPHRPIPPPPGVKVGEWA